MTGTTAPASTRTAGLPTVPELLELEWLGDGRFRTAVTHHDPYPLFGGQIMAQALRAAAHTVPAGAVPHSLQGYFLRAGAADEPVRFTVRDDRTGRSFAPRRVEAEQAGRLLCILAASFHRPEGGPVRQQQAMPAVTAAAHASRRGIPRLLSFETRRAEETHPHDELPTRFWARCVADLGDDPILHACALTYLSDISSGVAPLDGDDYRSAASLNHALWVHRRPRMDEWHLVDLVPGVVGEGRGWYSGSVFAADGPLVASLAQETLFRPGSGRYFHLED